MSSGVTVLVGCALVLVIVAGLFMVSEQNGFKYLGVSQDDTQTIRNIVGEEFSKISTQNNEELKKLGEMVGANTKRLGEVETSIRSKIEEDRSRISSLEQNLEELDGMLRGNKVLTSGKGSATAGTNGAKSDMTKSPSSTQSSPTLTSVKSKTFQDGRIEDFSSCANFNGIKTDKNLDTKGGRKYEMVRLGVSEPCDPDVSTDLSVFFTWQESDTCSDAAKAKVTVLYWRNDEPSAKTAVNAQMTGCFIDDQKRTWRFFTARMSHLVPDTEYVYVLEQEKELPQRVFFSVPLAGSELETNLILFGDTQMGKAKDVIDSLAKLTAYHDLVIHVGDGTYATNTGDCYGKGSSRDANTDCGWNCTGVQCAGVNRMSAAMLDRIRPWVGLFDQSVKGRFPWMTTMGNHDNDLQWFLSERPVVASALPGVDGADVPFDSSVAIKTFAHSDTPMKELMALAFEYMKLPHFYSFDYGKVHVVSLGSEDNPNNAYEQHNGQPLTPELLERFDKHFGPNSPQYKWLVRDLKATSSRRDKVPWIVVFTHRPLYHSSTHHPNCGPGGDWYVCLFRDTYEPLFKQYGVNVVATGHSHHYSRSHPMFKGNVDKDRGVVHSTIGTGGFELTNHFGSQPSWIAFRQGTQFGYVRMTVKNATHAKWMYMVPEADAGSKILDETWLVRKV